MFEPAFEPSFEQAFEPAFEPAFAPSTNAWILDQRDDVSRTTRTQCEFPSHCDRASVDVMILFVPLLPPGGAGISTTSSNGKVSLGRSAHSPRRDGRALTRSKCDADARAGKLAR